MKPVKSMSRSAFSNPRALAVVVCLLSFTMSVGVNAQQEPGGLSGRAGLDRLMHRASMDRPFEKVGTSQQSMAIENPLRRGVKSQIKKEVAEKPTIEPQVVDQDGRCNSACLIPNAIESAEAARRASYNPKQTLNFTDPARFTQRPDQFVPPDNTLPVPLGYGLGPYVSNDDRNVAPSRASNLKKSVPGYKGWNPEAGRDEYVYDGSDRGEKVQVDNSWNVTGLQTEDTIGHFDTLDGRRIVTPSNRVAIYAPRFGAVRKIDGVFNADLNLPVGSYEKRLPIAHARGKDDATTTKQNIAVNRYAGSDRASGFIDQTRGVVADKVTHLFGIRNTFEAYENLSLIRFGRFSSGETARLRLGIQSALVWEDDLGLQVTVNKATPVITRDVKMVQELLSVKSEDGTAILRVTKIASKIAARPGELVNFTIRFDNMSGKRIGNVTIIDNLTRRLEYVPDSSECSVKADFINKRNQADSLMLRWEITDPIEPHEGGVIRFQCRVR